MNKSGKTVWRGMVLLAVILLTGCAHGPPRVDCERELVPINAPAPMPVQPVLTPEDPAVPEGKTP